MAPINRRAVKFSQKKKNRYSFFRCITSGEVVSIARGLALRVCLCCPSLFCFVFLAKKMKSPKVSAANRLYNNEN